MNPQLEVAANEDPSGSDLDDQMEAIARKVPGFAGASIGEDGVIVLNLVDPSKRKAAESAIAALLPEEAKARGFVTRSARYDYRQLRSWRNAIRKLNFSAYISLDIDEASGSLRVATSGDPADIDVELAAIGVPLDAVMVERAEPFGQASLRPETASLIDSWGLGGIQITGYMTDGTKRACTLGAYLRSIGGAWSVALTNSHCSMTQGVVDGVKFYAPDSTKRCTFVGVELRDPPFFSGGACPANKLCRFSDAMIINPTGGCMDQNPSYSRVALPSRPNSWWYEPLWGFRTLTGKTSAVLLGATLNKVGMATGLSYGKLSSTCFDTDVAGTNLRLLCQNAVTGDGTIVLVGNGDSGSLVWQGNNLVGLVWGMRTANELVYSPVSGLERDLGSITVW